MSYVSHGTGRHWAIFSSRDAAITAATAACRWDVGGYDSVSIHPVGTEPPETQHYEAVTDWLFEGEYVWDDPSEETGVFSIVRRFMQELARRVADRPQELADVEWRDLERLLFEVFDALGYQARLTRPGKDGGYDLRLEAEGFVYFVEVKHWFERSKVGAGIIKRFT